MVSFHVPIMGGLLALSSAVSGLLSKQAVDASRNQSGVVWNQTGNAMLAFDALLLLALPLLLTFAAFVELPEFADRSHQLQRLPESIAGHNR